MSSSVNCSDRHLARVKNPVYGPFFSTFAHQRNAVFFRTKPTASVLENSFDPDIQVVTIKSHDNDVFYEISVVA